MNKIKQNQVKKDYFWNTMGSGITAAFSVVILWAVTRIMGPYIGGVFAFGYAVAQQLQTVGVYEMRTYQVTDIREVFKFETYIAARLLTCFAMIICALFYGFAHEGFTKDGWIIILICMLKVFDAFEDVFHGMFQQHNKLYLAGQALFYRMLITLLAFVVALFISRSLIVSCIITIIISTIAVIYLNFPEAMKMVSIRPKFQWNRIRQLLLACFPLFVGAFILQYLYNLPKYGMELHLEKEYQTYYSILFMPASVINLFSGFAFKPLLTSLAENWVENRRNKFVSTILKGMCVVAALTVMVVLGGYILGIPVLSWIYGLDLSTYRIEFVVLLLGGGFSAAGIILYYGLMVMRCQKMILLGYIITFFVSFPLVSIMTRYKEMLGAALLYMGLMFVNCCVMTVLIICGMKCRKKDKKGEIS